MRNISPSSLSKLTQPYGADPVLIVQVWWSRGQPGVGIPGLTEGSFINYADRSFPDEQIQGLLLEIGGLESVVKASDAGKSQSVSIKLDDTSGELKNIIDSIDIHKCPVFIYQWFAGLPITETFVVFYGEISSPIVWNEGDRTLSFDIVEQIEDKEVGFSPEEGQIHFIPHDLINKAWPLGFGTNIRVPALQLNRPPEGITQHPIAFGDPSLSLKSNQNQAVMTNLKIAQEINAVYAGGAALVTFIIKEEIRELQDALSADISAQEAVKNLINLGISTDGLLQENIIAANNVASNTGGYPGVISSDGSSSAFAPSYTIPDTYSGGMSTSVTTLQTDISASTTLLGGIDPSAALDPTSVESAISALSSELSKYEGFQKSYEAKVAQIAEQISQVQEDTNGLDTERLRQEGIGKTTGLIVGEPAFPQGDCTVRIGSDYVSATITGGAVSTPKREQAGGTQILSVMGTPYNPQDLRDPTRIPKITENIDKGKFVLVQPGTNVRLVSGFPIYYVVNLLPSRIHGVYARRTGFSGGAEIVTPVPRQYYKIKRWRFLGKTEGGFEQDIPYHVTMLIFPQALTSYDDGWTDDILVSYTSSIKHNTIEQLKWLIKTYTKFTYDPISFNHVKAKVKQYPSHFVLYERKNVLTLLEEIAFQARLAIWLDRGIFYVRYLPEEPTSIDTITEADIQVGTLQIGYTPTEDIVTKFVANWKHFFEDKNPYEIVLRQNLLKYGMIEKKYDFYIYSIFHLVLKAATFWIIRKSNTWKLVRFKTFINKLNIETFDCITLDIGLAGVIGSESVTNNPLIRVANTPIKGIVQQAKYDPNDNSIDMEVWLPIRMGEMEYNPFFWPAGLSKNFFFPNNQQITDGGIDTRSANRGLGGVLPGVQVKVDNSPLQLPDLLLPTYTFDRGAFNLSDNHSGQGYLLQSSSYNIQPGYVTGTPGNPNVISVIENVASPTSINDVPRQDLIDQNVEQEGSITKPYATNSYSAFHPGALIDVGLAGLAKVTHVVDSVLSDDGATRTTTIHLDTAIGGNIEDNDVVLSGLGNGDIADNVDDANDYDGLFNLYPLPGEITPPPTFATPALAGAAGGGVPIKIVSGTGDSYTALAYPNGIDDTPQTITVKVLQIDPSDTIPPDTWLIATKIGDNWYCQPSIWY